MNSNRANAAQGSQFTQVQSNSNSIDDSSFLGRGWQFPPTFSGADKQVVMVSNEANINQSIDLILQTQRGERALLPFFGSDLRQYVFRNKDATLMDQITKSVRSTLLNGEPRIRVDEVLVEFLEEPQDTVSITVKYTVKKTNTRHNHVFPFSLLEGTNLTIGSSSA